MSRKFKEFISGRTQKMFCGECEKYIPENIQWICGHCDTEHRSEVEYSFLKECRRCGMRPAAFICPHCQTVWCHKKHNNGRRPAVLFLNKTPPLIPESEAGKRRMAHEARQEEMRFKIDEAKMAAELRKWEDQRTSKVSLTEKEKLEERFEKDSLHFLGAKEICRKWKGRYEELYKEDPKMLKDALEFLRHWEANQV